jgi:cobalamin biosynthesis Mg chelatase CobN
MCPTTYTDSLVPGFDVSATPPQDTFGHSKTFSRRASSAHVIEAAGERASARAWRSNGPSSQHQQPIHEQQGQQPMHAQREGGKERNASTLENDSLPANNSDAAAAAAAVAEHELSEAATVTGQGIVQEGATAATEEEGMEAGKGEGGGHAAPSRGVPVISPSGKGNEVTAEALQDEHQQAEASIVQVCVREFMCLFLCVCMCVCVCVCARAQGLCIFEGELRISRYSEKG